MKCLIIGLGSIAKKHIQVLETHYPKIELFAWRSKENSPIYNTVQNITNWKLVEERRSEWDFVLLCNPTHLHADFLQKMLDWPTAFFIEKPLFHTLTGNEMLVRQLQYKAALTYVACNLRFLDCLAFTKDYLSTCNSVIQEVNSYCGSYLPDWRPHQDYTQVYSANKAMGGGVHLDLIHEIDYLYWLFDKPQQVHSLLRSRSHLQIDAIDYANYNLEYPNFVANVVLNYFRRDTKRTLEIVFEDRTLFVNLVANTVHENEQLLFSSEQKGIDTYQLQLDYFINLVVDKNKDSFNSVEAGWETLQICLDYETKR